MSSEGRYLGFGLVIGVLIAALALGALLILRPSFLHSVQIPIPTPQSLGVAPRPAASGAEVTATFTPVSGGGLVANVPAGLNILATPTIDPVVVTINGGGLIFTGPLSNAQQVALYRASLPYVQPTVQDSKRESKEINGVGYGDPTNICGSLAIAILRDAGILSPDIVPHDYWLLNPVTVIDQRKIAKAFPPDKFTHVKITTPLNKVDWAASPLEPGDFLFIWHGSWGNFDHMLVVNRVDSQKRAYAVTNYGTPDGYIIAETMLYDPNDPSAGIFHTWTQQRDQILGSTGFGGYEIWRWAGTGT
jgi:hypothetical protein